MDKKHLHQMMFLDIMRFISCLIVVDGHFTQTFLCRMYGLSLTVYNYKQPLFALYYDLSRFAVMVFFVLSGFLITYSVLNDINKYGSFELRRYLKKRFLRIFPPLWFSILLTIIIYLTVKNLHLFGSETYLLPGDLYSVRPKMIISLKEVIQNAFLIPGMTGGMNGPLWSLSYEFFYYMVFGAIVLLLNKQIKSSMWLSLIIGLPILALVVMKKEYSVAILNVFYLFPIWLLGAFLAFLYSKEKLKTASLQSFAVMTIGGIICWIKLPVILQHPVLVSYVYALLTIYVMNIALVSNYTLSPFLTLFSQGSKYTYTLYLIHFPIALFLLSLIGSRLLSYHWYHYALLNMIFILLTTITSYFLSLVLENRKYLEEGFKSSHLFVRRLFWYDLARE